MTTSPAEATAAADAACCAPMSTNVRQAASLVSKITSENLASIKRFARRPPILPTPINPMLCSDITQLLEHFPRDSETVHSRRNAAVNRDLQKDLFDLVLRHTVRQRAAHVGLDLVRTIESRKHGEIQQAAGLLIQTGAAPDLSPAVLRDEFLQRAVEIIRRRELSIHEIRSQNRTPD